VGPGWTSPRRPGGAHTLDAIDLAKIAVAQSSEGKEAKREAAVAERDELDDLAARTIAGTPGLLTFGVQMRQFFAHVVAPVATCSVRSRRSIYRVGLYRKTRVWQE
jgi:hypothetical protein